MIHFYTFIASLITVGLKGFQHKNVIGNHYKLVFFTAYIMALGDVLVIGLIVKGGWIVCFSFGSGAALGMVLSMFIHNKFIKRINK